MIMPYVVISTLPQSPPFMFWVNIVRETAEMGNYLSALCAQHRADLLPFSAASYSKVLKNSWKEFVVISYITYAD